MKRVPNQVPKIFRLNDAPFLATDKWCVPSLLDHKLQQRVVGASKFAEYVLARDYASAWKNVEPHITRDPQFLANFKPSLCSRFLNLLPDGSIDSSKHWLWAWKFANAMKKGNHDLTSQDYASLINMAFKAHDYHTVQDIWLDIELQTPHLLSDVNLWNAYIQAACQTYPLFWPGPANPRRSRVATPPLWLDPVQILQKMEVNSVAPNARTLEHVLLAFARKEQLHLASNLVNTAWLDNLHDADSLLAPSESTLVAIIEAFAFNNELKNGVELMLRIQSAYNISLSSTSAIFMWTRLLRHVVAREKDHQLFNQVWALIESNNVVPTVGMWSIREEHLVRLTRFDDMMNDLPKILAMSDADRFDLAKSVINRVVKGYTNTGRALQGLALLEEWSQKGLDLRPNLEDYVRRRSGMTFEQLQVYKDDDDNDWF